MTPSPGDGDPEVEKDSITDGVSPPSDPIGNSTESQDGLTSNVSDVGDEGLSNDENEGATDNQESGESEQAAIPEVEDSSNTFNQFTGAKRAYSSSNSSVVQFLALYLLVLAFFIWLVSLARFDGVKSLAVINALKSTFETKQMEKEVTELRTLIRSKVSTSNQFEDNIRGLFSTLFEDL